MSNNERNMELHVKCHHCGEVTVVRVREEDLNTFCSSNRPYVQVIFPYLTPAERELLISHTCNECWQKMFSIPEEDEVFEYDEE